MKHWWYLSAIGLSALMALGAPTLAAWEVAEDCGNGANLRGVAFATQEKGIAFGEAGDKLFFSVDGGNNWGTATVDGKVSDEKVGWFDGLFSDGLTGWVVGSYDTGNPPGKRVSYLLKTTDGGATWMNQQIPEMLVNGNLFRVWFDKAGNGWALPYGGHLIFRTTDGGKTWQQSNFREAHPTVKASPGWIHLGLHVFDAQHVVVSGGFGILLETKDGGSNWRAMDTGQSELQGEGLADVCFVDEKQGWVVGEKGVILHTSDGGKSWEKQTSGVQNTLSRVKFLADRSVGNAKVGYAVGRAVYQGSATARYNGALLATEDGGKTWKNVNPTTSSLLGICVLDAKHAWAVGGVGGSGSEPKVMILRKIGE